MNAAFDWWLLIVGLVLGAALTWLVMADSARRDIDITEAEQRSEARWIATVLSAAGRAVATERVEEILRLHREYLAAPPPDEPVEAAAEPSPGGYSDFARPAEPLSSHAVLRNRSPESEEGAKRE